MFKYSVVFAWNAIDIMLTHDHDENTSLFQYITPSRWRFSSSRRNTPVADSRGEGVEAAAPYLLAQNFFFEKPPFSVHSSLRAFAIMTTGLTDCLLRFSKLLNSPVDTPSINGRGLPDWATHRLHEYFLLKPLVAETSDSYQYILHAYGSL